MKDAPQLEAQLRYFRSLELDEAIRVAALGLKPNGKRHSHQRWIPQASLDAAAIALQSVRTEIENCDTFEKLHDLVQRTTQEIPRFRRTTCYDTALRIGAQLARLPNLVFLHAGTTKGFRAMGLRSEEEAVSMNVFPAPLRELRPHEVEDFLCIYKDQLAP
jgi:hypothetical protein